MTVSLIGFVIEPGAPGSSPKIVDEFARWRRTRRQARVAEVRTAVPLTDEQRDRLAEALSDGDRAARSRSR